MVEYKKLHNKLKWKLQRKLVKIIAMQDKHWSGWRPIALRCWKFSWKTILWAWFLRYIREATMKLLQDRKPKLRIWTSTGLGRNWSLITLSSVIHCWYQNLNRACSSVFFDSNSKETFCNNNDGSTSLKMQPQRSSNRVGHHARSPHVVWNRLTHHDVQKQRQKWPLMWTVCPKGLVQLNLYLAFLEKFQRLLIKIGFLRFHYTRWKWDSPHPSQLSRLKLKHLRNP